MRKETFDPNDISKDDMNKLADAIEEYKDSLMSVMVIPEEIVQECEDKLKEGLRRTDRLIKKLRKGDRSVFKDDEELNEYF